MPSSEDRPHATKLHRAQAVRYLSSLAGLLKRIIQSLMSLSFPETELRNRPKAAMAEMVGDLQVVPKVVMIISSLLERVAEHNDAAAEGSGSQRTALAAAFQGLSRPSISVRSYLERIFLYANCSPSCYVVAYIYLDRFLDRHPSVTIDSCNVHRFLITSVLTAVKFMDDIHYSNIYFAKIGGIGLMEMNYLEVDFLFGLRFNLNVDPVTFASYCSILQGQMYAESTPSPAKLLCSLSEEESVECLQKQLASREVYGT